MTKKSFTNSSRDHFGAVKLRKFWKKVKSKKRRQVGNDDIAAFERKFTSAYDIG